MKLSVGCYIIHPMTTTTMTGIPVGSFTPGTPEWQQLRRDKLGGSEIAAVLGLSPYESRFSLWHRKQGTVPPQAGSSYTEWGNRLEAVIFEKFTEQHPDQTWTYNPGSYLHVDRPWQLATPDGASPDMDVIVDIKTAQNDDEWGDEGTDEIPIHYRAQMLWNMNVLGAQACWVPVLIRGCTYREYLVTLGADGDADTETLLAAGQQFIADLEAGIPPDIDAHSATREIIKQMHPDVHWDESVEVGSEVEHDYLMSELIYKAAKTERDSHINHIMAALGTARYATAEGRRFAYRTANLYKETGTYGQPYLRTDRKRLQHFQGRPQIKEAS